MRNRTRTRRLRWLAAVSVAGAAAFAGCGGSDSGAAQGDGSKAGAKLDAGWLFYGPKQDGGWNLANWQEAQSQLAEKFGDAYSQRETDNVPYAPQAAQLAEGFIQQGSNVLIDTVGLADIFHKVCARQKDVTCLQTAPAGKLPPNTTGYWAQAEIPNYVAGVTAGLLTKKNTVGYIAGYENPNVMGGVNSFALGCRSVNPDCTIRVIVTNDFFNPPKTTQAAGTLVDAGADVLRGWVDDPSYCTTAKQRGVLAIPEFADAATQCGDALATSTVWDFSSFFVDQLTAISEGRFEQEDMHWVDPKQAFSLGEFGPKVPEKVAKQVQETLDGLTSGEVDAFAGPIRDSAGKVRVPEGESLTKEFIYSKWDWTVEGVVMGKG